MRIESRATYFQSRTGFSNYTCETPNKKLIAFGQAVAKSPHVNRGWGIYRKAVSQALKSNVSDFEHIKFEPFFVVQLISTPFKSYCILSIMSRSRELIRHLICFATTLFERLCVNAGHLRNVRQDVNITLCDHTLTFYCINHSASLKLRHSIQTRPILIDMIDHEDSRTLSIAST